MIPGAPSDSKDKESDSGTDTKTDTKADTAEGSNPESGAAGESNDQNEQEKRVNPKISRREVKKPR